MRQRLMGLLVLPMDVALFVAMAVGYREQSVPGLLFTIGLAIIFGTAQIVNAIKETAKK